MELTPEKVVGTKFEVWLEKLFSDLWYPKVRRNVEYHYSRYVYRQVDVEYRTLNPFNPLVIVEAKYSSGGNVRAELREEKKKHKQRIRTIDNIVNELEERRQFVKARKAVLVTNRLFAKEVYEEAKKYDKIEVYDHIYLEELDKKREQMWGFLFRRKSIDEQILAIDLRKYDLGPHIHYF